MTKKCFEEKLHLHCIARNDRTPDWKIAPFESYVKPRMKD